MQSRSDGRCSTPGTGRVFALATSATDAAAVLAEANRLPTARGRVTVLVPHLIERDARRGDVPPRDGEIRAVASEAGLEVRVYVCLCRTPLDIFRQFVTEASTVILGAAASIPVGPPSGRDLAAALRARGHTVIVVAPVSDESRRNVAN